jgi:ubiquitin carboxyl-terminal hydrolase 34
MLLQLMKLIAFLELSERSDYNPREFCFSYKDFNGGPTNMREQNDTHEFLNIAFDRVENALRDTPQKYLLQNVLGGKTCSVTICKGCGSVNMSSEQFNFSLEVQNQNSIHDDLNRLVTGETINDYQCNACKQRVDIEKKTVVEVLPNTLILHLQRMIFDMDTFMNKKLNTRVEFPQVLNMRG